MISDRTRLQLAMIPPDVLDQIDRICDRFEAAWESGARPRIEEDLSSVAAAYRPALLRDLIAAELAARRRRGERPAAREYGERFAADPSAVAAAFGAEVTQLFPVARGVPAHEAKAQVTFIGRYAILSPLEVDGSQAELYRVLHPQLAKDMVLKLGCRPIARGCDELVREGRILAELDHPGLVRIHDLDFHEGRPFLVMDYVPGSNLQQHAEPHRPGPRRWASIVAEVAGTLAFVHDRGIVHQDIKPTNILIDAAGRPRLIDFGMARLRGAWAEDGPTGGTLAFMPPEQARGDPGGPHSDIFALGAVLYFLLTGQAPFACRDKDDSWDRARRCDYDASALQAAGVPRTLEQICLKAMSARPADRYVSAMTMHDDLRRYLRRPARLCAIAALAAFVLGGGLLYELMPRPSPSYPQPMMTGPQASPAVRPFRGRINLLVVRSKDGTRRRLWLQDQGALPVRADDEVRVEARLDRLAYLYLFWIRADGQVTPLYPWKDGDWSLRPDREQQADELGVPDIIDDVLIMPSSPPGSEALVLLARLDAPLAGEAAAELRRTLTAPPSPMAGPLREAVWLEDGQEVAFESMTGTDQGRHGGDLTRGDPILKMRKSDDFVLRIRRLVKEQVQPLGDYTQVVLFPNWGGR